MSDATTPHASAPVPRNGIRVADALRWIRATGPDRDELFRLADATRAHYHGDRIALCGIVNAKSGRCPEDCAFCSQSVKYKTGAPEYPLLPVEDILTRARKVKAMGARAFSIVMAVRRLKNPADVDRVCAAIERITHELGLECCGSLGRCSYDVMRRLKAAGLVRYHHNLETARSHFRNIVTTYDYEESVETIRAARALGLHACSGGIFGMGESPEQRVELGETLRELDVESVPLNFLNPRPGTPLYGVAPLDPVDGLQAVAVFRLLMPAKDILIAGGREAVLGETQRRIFSAGANGMMVGNYLTTANRPWEADQAMVTDQGLTLRGVELRPEHLPAAEGAVQAA